MASYSEESRKSGVKRIEISSTPVKPSDKKYKQETVSLSNRFTLLDVEDEGETPRKEKYSLHESVEMAVREAFSKFKPTLTPKHGQSMDIATPSLVVGENLENVSSIIISVMSVMHPMLMEAVAATITATTETIKSVKRDLEEIRTGKEEILILQQSMETQKSETEKLEQYSRKENVKVFGLSESDEEDLEDKIVNLASDIGVPLERRDISVCHRLRGNGKSPRPVIVKFVRRKTKSDIMKAKKTLKSKEQYKNVYINDDLTSLRNKIVKGMRDDDNIKKVWTIDGRIFCVMNKEGVDTKISLDSISDTDKLGWSNDKLKDLHLYVSL